MECRSVSAALRPEQNSTEQDEASHAFSDRSSASANPDAPHHFTLPGTACEATRAEKAEASQQDLGSFVVEQAYTPRRQLRRRLLQRSWRARLKLHQPGDSLPTIAEASDDEDEHFRSRAFSDTLAVYLRRPTTLNACADLSSSPPGLGLPERNSVLMRERFERGLETTSDSSEAYIQHNRLSQKRKLRPKLGPVQSALETSRPEQTWLAELEQRSPRRTLPPLPGSSHDERRTLPPLTVSSHDDSHSSLQTSADVPFRARSQSEVGPRPRPRLPDVKQLRSAQSLEELMADAQQRLNKYKNLDQTTMQERLSGKPPRAPAMYKKRVSARPSWLEDLPRASPIPLKTRAAKNI